jgi:hypothetical protein
VGFSFYSAVCFGDKLPQTFNPFVVAGQKRFTMLPDLDLLRAEVDALCEAIVVHAKLDELGSRFGDPTFQADCKQVVDEPRGVREYITRNPHQKNSVLPWQQTILFIATQTSNLEAVKYLLTEAWCDPNVANSDVEQQTPLHIAQSKAANISSGQSATLQAGTSEQVDIAVEICALLKDNGAVPPHPHRYTPMHTARTLETVSHYTSCYHSRGGIATT